MTKKQLENFALFIVLFNDPKFSIEEINQDFSMSLSDRTTNEEALDIYIEAKGIKLDEEVDNG